MILKKLNIENKKMIYVHLFLSLNKIILSAIWIEVCKDLDKQEKCKISFNISLHFNNIFVISKHPLNYKIN